MIIRGALRSDNPHIPALLLGLEASPVLLASSHQYCQGSFASPDHDDDGDNDDDDDNDDGNIRMMMMLSWGRGSLQPQMYL